MSFEVQLVLGVLFGLAGWQYALHLEGKYGVSAWGLPSWAWGLITGLSLLIGVVLMAIAERALAKDPEDAPLGLAAYAEQHAALAEQHAAAEAERAAVAPASAHGFPDVPAQTVREPSPAPVPALVPVPVAPAPVPVPAPVPAAAPAAGWHPDPSGRFHHRWWDGERWTADVSTDGVAAKDR
ncbi:MAG TPA: DUF2510 domain-containing protein [Mycobacteriales bacterium]|nr:DUF2510 domain-containing protein [Mycobacteriales bacterium]